MQTGKNFQAAKSYARSYVESSDHSGSDSATEKPDADHFTEQLSPSRIEAQLREAIAKVEPWQTRKIAEQFLKRFHQIGLSEHHLQQKLHLSTHHPEQMTADDVSKLAAFAYQTHPDSFQEVLAKQQTLMQFLSNSIVIAIFKLIEAKWLNYK
ncbi:MAG: hypothetical protein BRC59_00390 [Cyanobacteria bacterium SW_4_48_29]|nr:MAG: hypothetical protein BRC37_09885 [Cyanobacteria bacterium QH_3_48_40]PSP31051.1 MAG: hypothetical protein BRC59_00390 [Cyanobacteria bacterium SW_4_48_29]